MLSKQAITGHQRALKEELGQDITVVEVEKQGTRLLKFFEILIKIDQRNRAKNKNGNKKIT